MTLVFEGGGLYCVWVCIYIPSASGRLGRPPLERFSRDSAAAQAAEGDQEEAGPQDSRHDKEDQWRGIQRFLEGVQHKVSEHRHNGAGGGGRPVC